jgi:hypothetical protein
VLLGVEAIDDLDSVPIAEHDPARRAVEAAPRGFALDTRRELARHLVGVLLGRALDGGRVADRARVAHGRAFLVPFLGTPDRAQLDLARLGRAVGLLARTVHQLLLAHRHAGAVHPKVQRRRHRPLERQRVDPVLLVLGDLAPERLGRSLDMLGGHVHPGQLGQELVAFLEADHRAHPPDHALATPGDRDPPSRPSARSRGQKPLSHGSQW